MKYSKIILALEELYNVELGNAYCNNSMCREFISLTLKVLQKLKSSNFCSALWDRTTDVSVSEKETMFVLCVDKIGSDGEVLIKTEFLELAEVNHAHAEGISVYESFEQIGM